MNNARDVPMPAAGLVVVGASAGGVQALSRLVTTLPGDFPLPVVVVQHVDPHHRSLLPEILRRLTSLTVETATEGTALLGATLYLAPPGLHVVITPERTLSLSAADRVHFVRPSADVLFESAARVFASSVIAVVLTGTGEDGAAGVQAVSAAGGTVIAQDEQSADYFGMPGAAIRTGCVDQVLTLDAIGAELTRLARAIGAP